MRSCLVAYVKHFKERRVRRICKMEKLEIRAVIKYLCKKFLCLPRKFMKTSWKPSGRSLSFLKHSEKGQQSLGGRERECVEDYGGSGGPKDAANDETVKVVHTLVMCDRRRDLRNIASEVDIHLWAVQTILTNVLGMSKVSTTWVLQS